MSRLDPIVVPQTCVAGYVDGSRPKTNTPFWAVSLGEIAGFGRHSRTTP
jgi:hypothetical protein